MSAMPGLLMAGVVCLCAVGNALISAKRGNVLTLAANIALALLFVAVIIGVAMTPDVHPS